MTTLTPPGRPCGPAVDRHAAHTQSASGTGSRASRLPTAECLHQRTFRASRGGFFIRVSDPRSSSRTAGESAFVATVPRRRSSSLDPLSPARSAEGACGSSDGRWAGGTRAPPRPSEPRARGVPVHGPVARSPGPLEELGHEPSRTATKPSRTEFLRSSRRMSVHRPASTFLESSPETKYTSPHVGDHLARVRAVELSGSFRSVGSARGFVVRGA